MPVLTKLSSSIRHILEYAKKKIKLDTNTALLLSADGVAGSQNNTFLDSSDNNLPITRTGGVSQGSFGPYGSYFSTAFNGTSDYLTVPDSAQWAFRNNDFTIEAWVKNTDPNRWTTIVSRSPVTWSAGGWSLLLNGDGAGSGDVSFFAYDININGGATGSVNAILKYTGSNMSDGKWHHIAVSRIYVADPYNSPLNDIYRLFVDGIKVAEGRADYRVRMTQITGGLWIGCDQFYVTQNRYINGNISNLRISNSCRYTANFTPPTAPFVSDANTLLLTCNSSSFADSGPSKLVIGTGGTPKISKNGPITSEGYNKYSAGGSGYFNGTGMLSVPDNQVFNIGIGTFTIEGWIFPKSTTGTINIISKRSNVANFSPFLLNVIGGKLNFSCSFAGTSYNISILSATVVIINNQWNHVAVCRDASGVIRLYANGALVGSATTTNSFVVNTDSVYIGAETSSVSNPLTGYLSDISFLKGTAKYTGASLTVPTTPLTKTSASSLLLNSTNASIFDASGNNDISTEGDVKLSNTLKYGNASLYFDGTGDYLKIDDPNQLVISNKDFSIECWVNFAAISASNSTIFDARPASTNGAYPCLYANSTGIKYFVNNAVVITSTTVPVVNTWYHIALSRYSTITKLFVNGVQEGNFYVDENNYGISKLQIGAMSFDSSSPLNGYIDDFRIVVGSSAYPNSFTPPTDAIETSPVITFASNDAPYVTSILLNGDTITDSSIFNRTLTNSNVSVNTSIKKYGSGSLYFNGTSSSLNTSVSPSLGLGTGDFTIEFWLNHIGTTASFNGILLLTADGYTGNYLYYGIFYNSGTGTRRTRIWNGAIILEPTQGILTNTWQHHAIVRKNGIMSIYLDGINIGSISYPVNWGNNIRLWVGQNASSVEWFKGYIDDFRIVKGKALYTANFTPPAAALTIV